MWKWPSGLIHHHGIHHMGYRYVFVSVGACLWMHLYGAVLFMHVLVNSFNFFCKRQNCSLTCGSTLLSSCALSFVMCGTLTRVCLCRKVWDWKTRQLGRLKDFQMWSHLCLYNLSLTCSAMISLSKRNRDWWNNNSDDCRLNICFHILTVVAAFFCSSFWDSFP